MSKMNASHSRDKRAPGEHGWWKNPRTGRSEWYILVSVCPQTNDGLILSGGELVPVTLTPHTEMR